MVTRCHIRCSIIHIALPPAGRRNTVVFPLAYAIRNHKTVAWHGICNTHVHSRSMKHSNP